ncbi:GntR family transcriptional regulator [Oceanomicrobium pacificus]|uniref:FCD domain-containing protein n=1 Tax=Oceanomicrobium pacificus TaxID=2692916 RepID=A0A6B0U253_9RHOB|nr:GntR family transcriptional regulator [Oceanomicrobium pacificus]MXU65111.1 FCD domain-containing protein [Oceanomicrobium pacificus]
MAVLNEVGERRTSADIVYDHLYEEIVSLSLLPGDKISEAEVAKRFGVSRQPVRDAFNRLGLQNLLLIRPQKATEVRQFSREGIENARFIRTAVEVEVLRKGARNWTGRHDDRIDENLDAQREAVAVGDVDRFHGLDYRFHELLCEASGAAFAFRTIAANKTQIDRLCILSLTSKESMEELIVDHEDLVAALRGGDVLRTEEVIRRHLMRLDPTVEKIYNTRREYFED